MKENFRLLFSILWIIATGSIVAGVFLNIVTWGGYMEYLFVSIAVWGVSTIGTIVTSA